MNKKDALSNLIADHDVWRYLGSRTSHDRQCLLPKGSARKIRQMIKAGERELLAELVLRSSWGQHGALFVTDRAIGIACDVSIKTLWYNSRRLVTVKHRHGDIKGVKVHDAQNEETRYRRRKAVRQEDAYNYELDREEIARLIAGGKPVHYLEGQEGGRLSTAIIFDGREGCVGICVLRTMPEFAHLSREAVCSPEYEWDHRSEYVVQSRNEKPFLASATRLRDEAKQGRQGEEYASD